MNSFWILAFILLAGGGISFALARIAIRLQQPPGLAALAGVLICWQGIALAVGRAPLAIAILLLIVSTSLSALAQWLRRESQLNAGTALGGYILAGVIWAAAAMFPVLSPMQIAAFSAAWFASAAAPWIAMVKARTRVAAASAGLGPLAMLALWLLIRATSSMIAARG